MTEICYDYWPNPGLVCGQVARPQGRQGAILCGQHDGCDRWATGTLALPTRHLGPATESRSFKPIQAGSRQFKAKNMRRNCRILQALRKLVPLPTGTPVHGLMGISLRKNIYPHCSRSMRVCEFYSPPVNLSSRYIHRV